MSLTALALAMTVLVGGIIAYWGDLIGRRFGKKRVSAFGLRPKHTAILITFITGIFISAITTTAMFLVMRPVRDVILFGEEAIRERPRLIQERDAKILELQIAQQKTEEAKREQQRIYAERAIAEEKLAKTKTQLQTAQRSLASALARVTSAESRAASAERAVQTARAAEQASEVRTKALQTRNRSLSTQNTQLAEANVKLNDEQAKLLGKQESLNKQIAQLDVQIAQKQKDNAELAGKNKEYDEQNQKIARQNETLTRINSTLEKVNRDLLDGNVALEERNRELKAQAMELASQTRVHVDEMSTRLAKLRTQRIAVHGGEDLARVVIPAHSSPDEVRQLLQKAKREASDTARSKGAGPSETNPAQAVEVVDKRFYPETAGGDVVPVSVSENDRITALIRRIADAPAPVCVLALAVNNTVENEPAAIDFQPYTDSLIYPRGRQVATRRIRAADAPDKLYGALLAYLKDVGAAAIERGVIPRYDPMTGAPQVGSLDWPELVQLAEKVRTYPGYVNLVALAKDDTHASDPLKLEFKISPGS